MSQARARQVFLLLLGLSAIVLAWSALVYLVGGFDARVWGIRFSSRGATRPLAAGIIVLAAAAIVAWRGRINPAEVVSGRTVTVAAALAILVISATFGSRAAGGSDAQGYVSQAHLWQDGRLFSPLPVALLAEDSPFEPRDFAPLGYRRAQDGRTIVPTYAPGVPLLMALAMTLFGDCAAYLLAPLCGASLILLTYAIGAVLTTRPAATVAALLMATSPALLFNVMAPMSDVPASAFWMAAVAGVLCFERPRPVLAGVAAGVAVLIRPNVVPLAAIPALMILARLGVRSSRGWMAAIIFSAVLAPFAGAIALLNAHLYGSPLESGYGPSSLIYDGDWILPNLRRYTSWLLLTQGPVLLAALPAFLLTAARPTYALKALAAAFLLVLLGCYLPYLVFEDWWYLRFLLPGFPLLFILVADGGRWIVSWLPRRAVPIGLVLFAALALARPVTFTAQQDFLELGTGEQRYADIGVYVRDRLPANAVLFSMQHSGSLRYYAGRPTIRYDSLEKARFEAALEFLRARGRHPYVVIDEWEEEPLKQRAPPEVLESLATLPEAILHSSMKVLLYDLEATDPLARPETVPLSRRPRCLEPSRSLRQNAQLRDRPPVFIVAACLPEPDVPSVGRWHRDR